MLMRPALRKDDAVNSASLQNIISLAANSELMTIGSMLNLIMQTIHAPDTNINELSRIIALDPAFSAKVLSRANSASTGIKRSITSIQEAIVFLGFNVVREIVLNMKTASFYCSCAKSSMFKPELLWRHSLAVAMCAKAICRRELRLPGDDVYAAALMHDIGIIIENQFARKKLEAALSMMYNERTPLTDAERREFGFDHGILGEAITTLWKIPEKLAHSIRYHHSPQDADPLFFREAAIIYVADFCMRIMECTIEIPPSKEEYDYFIYTLEMVKIPADSVEIIVEDTMAEVEKLEKEGELFV